MKDGEKVHESFNIFVQVNSRLLEFLMRWLLVLDLKEGLAECATVCVKSVVILKPTMSRSIFQSPFDFAYHGDDKHYVSIYHRYRITGAMLA